ncbi:HAD family hydrolase [Aestuariivita boseongensis]|uniref:HAD family hydrolase n=1 Tax=Aestuariivita boseongensis TaxID=1470562 RepID=UPI0006834AF6|nr:HAD family phosphatase [Aestuariivita boseongensis]
MIKAILFDMDGVLIDAKDWHYDALNRALGHFGYTISRESHLSTFDGLPTRQKLKMLTKSRGLPEGLHEFLNSLKQSYTMELSHQRCKPVFHHQFALSRLKNDNYLTAVCSNSVRQSVEAMLQLSGLSSFIDTMLSNEDVSKGKPDPEMYTKAMEILGVSPKECLILEDNDHGIEAALASGGHLMQIGVPADVTYQAIRARIAEIEQH